MKQYALYTAHTNIQYQTAYNCTQGLENYLVNMLVFCSFLFFSKCGKKKSLMGNMWLLFLVLKKEKVYVMV